MSDIEQMAEEVNGFVDDYGRLYGGDSIDAQ